MDHRVSKDMISQGMSVKGEKTTEELNNTQIGKIATPHNMMDAYKSMYEKKEDKEEVNEIVISGTIAALGGLAAKAGGALTAAKAGAGALAAKGAAVAKGAGAALKSAKVAGLASKAKTAGNVAQVASLVPSGGNGGSTPSGSRSGTLAAGNELDGDVIQELIDSGKFSEEEIKSITEISSGKLLDAARASEKARGKKAVAGDKEGAAKEVARSSKFFNAALGKTKSAEEKAKNS